MQNGWRHCLLHIALVLGGVHGRLRRSALKRSGCIGQLGRCACSVSARDCMAPVLLCLSAALVWLSFAALCTYPRLCVDWQTLSLLIVGRPQGIQQDHHHYPECLSTCAHHQPCRPMFGIGLAWLGLGRALVPPAHIDVAKPHFLAQTRAGLGSAQPPELRRRSSKGCRRHRSISPRS